MTEAEVTGAKVTEAKITKVKKYRTKVSGSKCVSVSSQCLYEYYDILHALFFQKFIVHQWYVVGYLLGAEYLPQKHSYGYSSLKILM